MKNYLTFVILIAVIFSGSGFAGGTETKPYTSSKTVSLNGLYFAGADGIIKSFSNPAGLIYLNESGIEISVSDRLAQSEFDNPSRGLFKSFKEDEFNFNGGFLWNISDRINAAVSYQQVIDYNVSWPYANYFQHDSLSALLVFDFYNNLDVDAISVSFAYKLDNFAFGITPVIYQITNKISFPQNNPLWASGVGTAAYQFEYDLEAWTFGLNVGMIAELSTDLKIALSARSAYSADLEGEAKSRMFFVTDSTDEVTELKSGFEMPWSLGFGMVYSLSTNFNFNFDLQYSLWSNIQSDINYTFSNPIWQSNLNETDMGSGIRGRNFILSFNNTIDVGLGIEFISQSNISYRAGYRFSQSPNSEETYNMLFPIVDQHVFSVGAGLRDGNLVFDAVLLYALGIQRDVRNDIIPNLHGSYNYDLIIPMVTLKYLLF